MIPVERATSWKDNKAVRQQQAAASTSRAGIKESCMQRAAATDAYDLLLRSPTWSLLAAVAAGNCASWLKTEKWEPFVSFSRQSVR
jgi:hypothetical protein